MFQGGIPLESFELSNSQSKDTGIPSPETEIKTESQTSFLANKTIKVKVVKNYTFKTNPRR
jgi:hypothetical protein